jgi:hypothetical protein
MPETFYGYVAGFVVLFLVGFYIQQRRRWYRGSNYAQSPPKPVRYDDEEKRHLIKK